MCGRYAFYEVNQLPTRFGLTEGLADFQANFNATPGSLMPVITQPEPKKVQIFHWGLVPAWAKDVRIGTKLINARSETLSEKPAYKRLLATNRCLLPANGFFEWQRKDGHKQAFYIRRKDGELVAMAGLFDRWKDAVGVPRETFTIITTPANKLISSIHERMPLLIRKESEPSWLQGKFALPKTIDPYELETIPVSDRVNKPENNDPRLIPGSTAVNLTPTINA